MASASADERLKVAIKEPVSDALRLEELPEVSDGHITLAVGAERIALAQRTFVDRVEFALVALVEVVIGIV